MARLRAHALPLSLNILMLYGNMQQLAKLHVSIFTLSAWTDCSSESIIKKCTPSPKSLEVNPCNLSHLEHGSWDLPLHTGSQVPSMTWMPTWQQFLEVRLGTCVESWVKQKSRPISQHKSHEYFCIR